MSYTHRYCCRAVCKVWAISDDTTEAACGASIFVYWIATSRLACMITAALSLIRSLILVLSSAFSSRWSCRLGQKVEICTIPQTRVRLESSHVARRMPESWGCSRTDSWEPCCCCRATSESRRAVVWLLHAYPTFMRGSALSYVIGEMIGQTPFHLHVHR